MNDSDLIRSTPFFLHAVYVAFVFSCLFFGALAFRQVVDNLSVRELRMGEDRDGFIDARVIIVLLALAIASAAVSITVGAMVTRSTIFTLALPMILFIQIVQLTLRALMQRTLVKTRGIVIRSVLFGSTRSARFEDIIVARFIPHSFWVSVHLSLPSEQLTFRIFLFSAERLQRIIASSCSAPVLWLSRDLKEHNVHPPTSSI